MGHQIVQDHMFLDGLEDAYDKGTSDGHVRRGLRGQVRSSRARRRTQFALTSLSRALAANNDGTFAWEIAPVTVTGKKGDTVIDRTSSRPRRHPIRFRC